MKKGNPAKPETSAAKPPAVLPGEELPVVNPFSPKDHFQKYQSDTAKILQEHSNSRWLRTSLDASLAQMAAVGADNREMRGARRFIETLLDIAEKNTPMGKLPVIKLETFDT